MYQQKILLLDTNIILRYFVEELEWIRNPTSSRQDHSRRITSGLNNRLPSLWLNLKKSSHISYNSSSYEGSICFFGSIHHFLCTQCAWSANLSLWSWDVGEVACLLLHSAPGLDTCLCVWLTYLSGWVTNRSGVWLLHCFTVLLVNFSFLFVSTSIAASLSFLCVVVNCLMVFSLASLD